MSHFTPGNRNCASERESSLRVLSFLLDMSLVCGDVGDYSVSYRPLNASLTPQNTAPASPKSSSPCGLTCTTTRSSPSKRASASGAAAQRARIGRRSVWKRVSSRWLLGLGVKRLERERRKSVLRRRRTGWEETFLRRGLRSLLGRGFRLDDMLFHWQLSTFLER